MSLVRNRLCLGVSLVTLCVAAVSSFQGQVLRSDSSGFPTKTLTPYSSASTDVPTFGSFLPIQCDRNGDLYFHLDNGSYSSGTVMRLEHGSWRPYLYKLPADSAKDNFFFEFSVSPLGKVRLLEQARSGQYEVFRFDSDTDDPADTRLQIPEHLWISDFVASDDGTVLVGGYYDETSAKELQGKSFLALVQRNGRLLKDLTQERPGAINLGDARKKHHDGGVTVGPDGNFYFASGRELLVFSASGDVLRKIPIPKLADDPYILSTTVAGDLISLQFGKSDKHGMVHEEFLVLTASGGDPYGLYVPSEELGDNCVCFSSRSGYTFLRVENGKLKFLTAPLS